MDFNTAFDRLKAAIGAVAGITSAEVLRERIALMNDRMDILLEAHENTQKELAETKAKCNQLNNEIARYREADEFVQHEGALFKKDATGSYITMVYCPSCRKIASGGFDPLPFVCDACKWCSPFRQRELKKIMSTLP